MVEIPCDEKGFTYSWEGTENHKKTQGLSKAMSIAMALTLRITENLVSPFAASVPLK